MDFDLASYMLGKKSGGSGGTTDYSDLTNKPSINDVTLSGNKTSSDLGVQSVIDSNNKLSADLVDDTNATNKFVSASDKTTWNSKQDALVSGTNIKTINGSSVLGSGDIETEVIQYSTLPTASIDNLGQIVQYTGTTDSTYTNGYFYECVSDGESTPTYSWENVNVQASSGGGYDGDLPVYKIGDYTTNTQTFNIDNAKVGRYLPVNGNVTYKYIANGTEGYFYGSNSNGIGEYGITIYKEYSKAEVNENIGVCEFTYNKGYQYAKFIFLTIVKTATGVNFNQIVSFPKYLVAWNDSAQIRGAHTYYTLPQSSVVPTSDNQFTNKKYVDDKPTTYTGYDATKTQVLKNVQGVLTWVDE